MDCSGSENTPSNLGKTADELLRGREFAQQLGFLLKRSRAADDDVLISQMKDLVGKILNSFTNTISMLNCNDSVELSQIQQFDCSEETSKTSSSTLIKDRRGCYKRRNTSDSWTRESSALMDDGHAWRKYGQKGILNTKYPRNYFRCTRKTNQGCLATKQVQRIQENPPKYRTVYYGRHSCTNSLKFPEIPLHSNTSTTTDSSTLISFDTIPITTNFISTQHHHPASFSSLKQEFEEDRPSDPTHNQSLPSDCFLLPDVAAFESSEYKSFLSFSTESDHGDVISVVFEDDDLLKFEF